MHNLMRENIAIDAEMLMTSSALIPTTHAHPFRQSGSFPVLPRWHFRKWLPAGIAMGASQSPLPGHFDPVHQGEEVVVASREMCGENERKSAGRTLSR